MTEQATDYKALVRDAKNRDCVPSLEWRLIDRLADAVEALLAEQDALRASFQEAEQIHERVVHRLAAERDALQARLRECERSFLAADSEMARTGHVRSYWVEYQARIAGQEVTD